MATETDQKTSTTTSEIAPDRPVATDTGASETAPSSRSLSRGRPRAGHSVPLHLPGPRSCETCLSARGRQRGAHVVCDECFALHWGKVKPSTVQVLTTRPDAWSLGIYDRILTKEEDGRTVAYQVAQSMKYAPRPIDEEKLRLIDEADLQSREDLSKRSEHRVLSSPRAAAGNITRSELIRRDAYTDAFLRDAGDALTPSKPRGGPKKLESDPVEIERHFRALWEAGRDACERYRPGDTELKKLMWAFLTLNVLVHGNLNMRALEKTPVTSNRSRSHWDRLRKKHGETLELMNDLVRRSRGLEATGLIGSEDETA